MAKRVQSCLSQLGTCKSLIHSDGDREQIGKQQVLLLILSLHVVFSTSVASATPWHLVVTSCTGGACTRAHRAGIGIVVAFEVLLVCCGGSSNIALTYNCGNSRHLFRKSWIVHGCLQVDEASSEQQSLS